MTVVVSSFIRTIRDQNQAPSVEAWLLLEFRSAGYVPGGEAVNLSPYFRTVLGVLTTPASGALAYNAQANQADISNTAAAVSTRMQIFTNTGSGAVLSELISGTAISGARVQALAVGY